MNWFTASSSAYTAAGLATEWGSSTSCPYFYATSPGDAFPVRRMIVIGLAPLLVISPLALLGGLLVPVLAGYLAVVFIGNTAGAVGDLWMTSRLFKFLSVPDATVVDLRDGMAVHSADARARDIAQTHTAAEKRPAGFIVHWVGAAMAVLALQVLVGLIGPIFTKSLLIGPAQFPLLAFERSSGGLAMTLNMAPAFLAGLVFALAARQLSRGFVRGAE